MYFQIKNVVLWPRLEDANPPKRVVDFELGKVNVITGESRSGKSAIIPIIDYCLGSRRCAIPVDVIRNAVSRYGVTVALPGGEYVLVTRKPPRPDGTPSVEMSVSFANRAMPVPDEPPKADRHLDDVKHIFNSKLGIPSTPHDETEWGSSRLSYRDLMHMVFQSQDVITNQNILFYKMHENNYRMRISTWFRFIVGAETEKFLENEMEVARLRRRHAEVKAEVETAKSVLEGRKGGLQAMFALARELGLYEGPVDGKNMDELLEEAKKILDAKHDIHMRQRLVSLLNVNAEIRERQLRMINLTREIAEAKWRIKTLVDADQASSYVAGLSNRHKERLQISKWMEDNTVGGGVCPFCGSTDHPVANDRLEKLKAALRRYEEDAVISPLPISTGHAIFVQQSKILAGLLQEQARISSYLAEIERDNDAIKEGRDNLGRVYALLGELRAAVETIRGLEDSSGPLSEMRRLQKKLREVEIEQRGFNVAETFGSIMDDIGGKAQRRLKTLDAAPHCSSAPMKFDETYINVKVHGEDGLYHPLSEIGSASNWLSCHIAFTCALQEYFCERARTASSYMLSFAVFDQPSQAYFPQMNISGEYSRDDEAAVRKMFTTLADSILSCNGGWQAIVLEHAGERTWGNIDGVHLSAVWNGSEKLIPEAWYANNPLLRQG